MATGKKSFVLYSDFRSAFDELTDKEAGQLIKHIFSYVNDENPETDNRYVRIAFSNIKEQLKRDLVRWSETKLKRSEAGKASAAAKKQNSTKSTSVESVEQTSTKSTVNDNVNVNVINNKYMSEIKISDVPIHLQEYFKIAQEFQKLFIDNLKQENAPTVHQEKATFKKYVTPIRLMIEQKEATLQDLRDVWQFIDSPKGEFWKSNILSTSKLREQIVKLIMSARETKK